MPSPFMPSPFRLSGVLWLAILGLLPGAGLTVAAAHTPEDLKGKTLSIYIPFAQAGGYDQYARLFARHVGRHLPGHPTVIPVNMPGANGLVGANYLYSTAPKDGTAIGLLYQAIAQDQVVLGPKVQYDVRQFNWIGRITSTAEILYAWHRVPVKRIEDLTKRELIVAAAGPLVSVYARLLNASTGARFRIVRGYKGTQEIHIALERGEVEAAYSSLSTIRAGWSRWLENREIAKTDGDRQMMNFFASAGTIGRAIVAPPGLSPERLAMLRAAFWATMKDQQFLADARQMKLDVEPMSGEDLRRIAETIVAIGPAERERVIEMMK